MDDEPLAQLAKLQEARAAAARRVDDLEREARESTAATQQASAALAELERVGGSASKWHQLEQALATARQRPAEPWAERIAGARAAVRDRDAAVRAFTSEHLSELVELIERDGEAAAGRVDRAAEELVAAHAALHGLAQELGALVSPVRRPELGDVPLVRSDELARLASTFLATGGETPVALDRRRPPWDALLGEAVGEDAAAEVAEAVRVTA